MKQILYISPFSHIGGGEISLLAILKTLDRERFSPHLICYEDGPFVKNARSFGFKDSIFERGPFYTDPLLIMRLISYIKKNGIDLIHVNSLDIRALAAAPPVHEPPSHYAPGVERRHIRQDVRARPRVSTAES